MNKANPWRSRPAATALLNGDEASARRAVALALQTHRIQLIADHEPQLAAGVFVDRRSLGPAEIVAATRSWEKFDRAFVEASESVVDEVCDRAIDFIRESGLVCAISQTHLLRFRDLRAVASWTADDWHELSQIAFDGSVQRNDTLAELVHRFDGLSAIET